MKIGFEAKLALAIILGFGFLIAGFYAYTNYQSKKKQDKTQTINEQFDSEPIDGRINLMSAGACTWSVKGGVLTMHETGNIADAGAVVISDNMNISKPITIKTKARFYNAIAPGWYGQSHFVLAEKMNYAPIIGGFDGSLGTSETPEGNLRISYRDKVKHDICWNGAADKWEICTSNTVTVFSAPSVYHIFEFYSDGEKWHFVLKDASGAVLEKTAPVPWSDTLNMGAPFQFMLGELSLGYYSTDMDVDFLYASYESK